MMPKNLNKLPPKDQMAYDLLMILMKGYKRDKDAPAAMDEAIYYYLYKIKEYLVRSAHIHCIWIKAHRIIADKNGA